MHSVFQLFQYTPQPSTALLILCNPKFLSHFFPNFFSEDFYSPSFPCTYHLFPHKLVCFSQCLCSFCPWYLLGDTFSIASYPFSFLFVLRHIFSFAALHLLLFSLFTILTKYPSSYLFVLWITFVERWGLIINYWCSVVLQEVQNLLVRNYRELESVLYNKLDSKYPAHNFLLFFRALIYFQKVLIEDTWVSKCALMVIVTDEQVFYIIVMKNILENFF